MTDQTCPLCRRILFEGFLEGWFYHTRDYDSPCVINSYTSDELKQANSQISRIKETAFKEGCLKAKQEVFDSKLFREWKELVLIKNSSDDQTPCPKCKEQIYFCNCVEVLANWILSEAMKKHGVE